MLDAKKKSWNQIVGYANQALSFSFSHSRKLSPVGASRTNQSFQFSRASKIALEGPQFIGLEVNGPKGLASASAASERISTGNAHG